jgi:hypothetical protein
LVLYRVEQSFLKAETSSAPLRNVTSRPPWPLWLHIIRASVEKVEHGFRDSYHINAVSSLVRGSEDFLGALPLENLLSGIDGKVCASWLLMVLVHMMILYRGSRRLGRVVVNPRLDKKYWDTLYHSYKAHPCLANAEGRCHVLPPLHTIGHPCLRAWERCWLLAKEARYGEHLR